MIHSMYENLLVLFDLSQMLTMRNGINLHPLCLPGTTLHPLQLSQMRPVIPQEPTNDSLLNHTNQFASTSNAPDMINTVPSSYAMEPSIRSHFGPFPLLTSPVVRVIHFTLLDHRFLKASLRTRFCLFF